MRIFFVSCLLLTLCIEASSRDDSPYSSRVRIAAMASQAKPIPIPMPGKKIPSKALPMSRSYDGQEMHDLTGGGKLSRSYNPEPALMAGYSSDSTPRSISKTPSVSHSPEGTPRSTTSLSDTLSKYFEYTGRRPFQSLRYSQ